MMLRQRSRYFIPLLTCLILAAGAGCQNNREGEPVATQEVTQTSAPIVKVATERPTAMVLATDTAVPEPATETPTSIPSSTPTPSFEPSPSPSSTMVPTQTPLPTPTATPTTLPLPDWLAYLNLFREMANLPPLSDQEAITLGSQLHSRYMVGNDKPTAHYEEKEMPFYDQAGDQAARNGNLFATSETSANYRWSINFWVSAPFHLLGILNPQLKVVGYGEYKEEVGDTQMAAVLDIKSHTQDESPAIEYPVMFPGDGSETWIVRHSMTEWPYPFDGCPGYTAPTGPPIILLIGDGSETPNVTQHRFSKGDEALESCLFDETSYRNNDSYAKGVGREILDSSDAIVIMPRRPLAVDESYTAQVTVNGETYTWSFLTKRNTE